MCLSHFSHRSVVLVLLSILLLWACKTTHSKGQNPDSVNKIAGDKLGTDIESFPNSTEEYILYVQKTNSSSPTNILKFIVLEVGTGKVATEQSFAPGYVKWITETSIEVFSVPGTIRKNEDLSDYKKTINILNINP